MRNCYFEALFVPELLHLKVRKSFYDFHCVHSLCEADSANLDSNFEGIYDSI